MDSFSKHDELHGATATFVCLRTDKRQGQSQISEDIASWWLQACFIFNPCEDDDFIWLPSNKYQNWVCSRGMEIPEVERGNGDFVPSISGGMNHKVPHLFLSVPGTTTEQWPLKPLHGLRWQFFFQVRGDFSASIKHHPWRSPSWGSIHHSDHSELRLVYKSKTAACAVTVKKTR